MNLDVTFLLWAGALLAGLVVLAIFLGILAARLFLNASRNGATSTAEQRGRESDAKTR